MVHMANLIKYHPLDENGNIDYTKVRYTIQSDETMLLFMKTGQMLSGRSIEVEEFLKKHREFLQEDKINNLALDYPQIWDAVNSLLLEEIDMGGKSDEK